MSSEGSNPLAEINELASSSGIDPPTFKRVNNFSVYVLFLGPQVLYFSFVQSFVSLIYIWKNIFSKIFACRYLPSILCWYLPSIVFKRVKLGTGINFGKLDHG